MQSDRYFDSSSNLYMLPGCPRMHHIQINLAEL